MQDSKELMTKLICCIRKVVQVSKFVQHVSIRFLGKLPLN